MVLRFQLLENGNASAGPQTMGACIDHFQGIGQSPAWRIKVTSSAVAPAAAKPVEVFTKTAPDSTANLHTNIFSSLGKTQVSKITLTGRPEAVSTTARMSSATSY